MDGKIDGCSDRSEVSTSGRSLGSGRSRSKRALSHRKSKSKSKSNSRSFDDPPSSSGPKSRRTKERSQDHEPTNKLLEEQQFNQQDSASTSSHRKNRVTILEEPEDDQHTITSTSTATSRFSTKCRTQLLLQQKSRSTSALYSSSNRKSKSKPAPNRRRSIDNSSHSAGSNSLQIKEESQDDEPTNKLVEEQYSLDSNNIKDKNYRNSTKINQQVSASNQRMNRGGIIEEQDDQQTTYSTSRFSTNPRRPSLQTKQQSAPTILSTNNTTTTNGTNNKKNNAKSIIVHTCDDKGRCVFHPNIQLRKKAIMGVIGGWKDILPVCPECEKQELKEMLLREREEIRMLESMLGRLDQHDVEYLNDDGLDEDGNYLLPSAVNSSSFNPHDKTGVEGPKVQITFVDGCVLPGSSAASSLGRVLPGTT